MRYTKKVTTKGIEAAATVVVVVVVVVEGVVVTVVVVVVVVVKVKVERAKIVMVAIERVVGEPRIQKVHVLYLSFENEKFQKLQGDSDQS